MSTIPEAESHPSSERARGGFFAVDRSAWVKACDLGLNAAVAYLVLARGTGKDHQHTAWSASAVSSRTSIGRRRASEAIDRLRQHRLVRRRRQGGSKPRYRLVLPKKTAALIWLPNTIVDAVDGAASSPVERIRQTGDVMLLRLFVDLYSEHHLQDDGGVSRSVVYQAWTRHAVGEFAEYVVYGFSPAERSVPQGSVVIAPHQLALTDADRQAGVNPNGHLAWRLEQLEAMRLIEWVPVLWEHAGPDAEPIHPVHPKSSISVERELGAGADAAGRSLATPGQVRWAEDQGCVLFVPVLRHMQSVAVVSVLRLTHRPHTKQTANWFSALQRGGAEHVRRYRELAMTGASLHASFGADFDTDFDTDFDAA